MSAGGCRCFRAWPSTPRRSPAGSRPTPQKAGVDGLMVLPAMVYKSDPRETMAHFRTVAAATDLPIMVYNNPVSYGVDITPEMFAELADEPKLVAIKESSENVRRITDLKNVCGDRYTLFCGVDDLVLESLLLGATGWVSGLVNAFPAENRLLWDLAAAGPLGRGPARSIAGTRRCCTSTRTSSSSSTSSWPCRNAAWAPRRVRRPAAAARGRGARADPGRHPPGDRDAAQRRLTTPDDRCTGGFDIQPCPRSDSAIGIAGDRLAHRRRADPRRGRGRPGPGRRVDGRAAGVSSAIGTTTSARRSSTSRAARTSWSAPCSASRSIRESAAGVIFFNNVGYLGMCGHGTIGVGATLAHLGRIGPGTHRLETPVGVVAITLEADNARRDRERARATARPRASRSTCRACGRYVGDVAWGGNWFFLVQDHGETLDLANVERLTDVTWRIRQAARPPGHHAAIGRRRDRPHRALRPAHGRRAPTARTSSSARARPTTARPAAPARAPSSPAWSPTASSPTGQVWRQESIIGSVFEGSVAHRWRRAISAADPRARPTSTPRRPC